MSSLPRKLIWNASTRLKLLARRQWPAWKRYLSILNATARGQTRCEAQVERKLLILAWEFPPLVTGGVYRPASFARYAAEAGWKTTVLTGPAPVLASEAGRYLEQSIPDSVAVHRIPAAESGPHPWPLPEIDGGILNAMAVYETSLALVEPGAPGVILSSGPPFHNFVAGMWLARRLGWKLVLDYRDEWTLGPFGFSLSDGVNHDWENQCLRQADQVIFTTQSQLDHHTLTFPELARNKCMVIHNGWEPDDFQTAGVASKRAPRASNEPIVVSFFGKLGGWSHPEGFLETLEESCELQPELRHRVEIRIVGQKPPAIAELLYRYVDRTPLQLIDHLPKADVCRMMQETDVLLLLNPPALSRYIPGKIYEYIASGTPVLLYGQGGEVASIVEDLQAGLVIPAGDAAALAKAFETITAWQPATDSKRTAWLEIRTRRYLVHQLLTALDELVVNAVQTKS